MGENTHRRENNQNLCKGLVKCSFCKKIFFRNNLEPHILVSHVDPADSSKVLCDECGKDFCG